MSAFINIQTVVVAMISGVPGGGGGGPVIIMTCADTTETTRARARQENFILFWSFALDLIDQRVFGFSFPCHYYVLLWHAINFLCILLKAHARKCYFLGKTKFVRKNSGPKQDKNKMAKIVKFPFCAFKYVASACEFRFFLDFFNLIFYNLVCI